VYPQFGWEERGTAQKKRRGKYVMTVAAARWWSGGAQGNLKPRRGDEAASAGPLAARRVAGTMG